MKARTQWRAALFASLLLAAGASIVAAQNADKPVANLRLALDASGSPMTPVSEPPEKVYKVPAGINVLIVAYDFQGTEPTDVSIRVLGPNGTIEFQEQKKVDTPGTHVVQFTKGDGVIADNEYVINAYVGEQQYLADSLQVAVGKAVIPESPSTAIAEKTRSTGPLPTAVASPTIDTGPGVNDNTPLVLAGVLLLVLAGVVVWAVRSAMAGNKA